jgi:uncharacterized protein (TIGR00725 family)
LFTHYLLEGLKSGRADADGDGFIDIDELYDYAFNELRSQTTQQTPRKWTVNQQGRILLAKRPDAGQTQSVPASESPGLRILVTGGLEVSPKVADLAIHVGAAVIDSGHTLINFGSRGVDTAAAEGAFKACRRLGVDPERGILVYRPRRDPAAEHQYGNLMIVGSGYDERRDIVIHGSDAVIVLGGSHGTAAIGRQSAIMKKPLVPIAVGDQHSAAIDLWHHLRDKRTHQLPMIPIAEEDLAAIGPMRDDIAAVAKAAVSIAIRLAQEQQAGARLERPLQAKRGKIV